MFNLVFFSTNRAKLSHFRHLGEKFGVGVKSFREASYYASYDEPVINDRHELLRLSYISALKQWQRRHKKIDDETGTFFFEDTSVRIESLSQDIETPGVNVKFWMEDMTFEKLDALLKNNGNDRRATVRSDIVMHLPQKWRELLGIKEEFLWVFGEVKGAVVNTEEYFSPNPVYPWLDNISFNRWFVPAGEDKPVGALNIEDADVNDFRLHAFEKIIAVLNRLQLIQSPRIASPIQLELPRVSTPPSVFVICGQTCVGKTTSAGWITDTYGIPHIEASDFMYKAFWDRHGLKSSIRIGDFAEAALKTQPGIVALPLAQHIADKQFGSVIVTGFRAWEEVEIFSREISREKKLELIYLDAPVDVRLARAIKRNRDEVTPEKFAAREAQEAQMGLGRIAAEDIARHIDNSGTLSNFFRRLRHKYDSAFRMHAEFPRQTKTDGNLEPLILLTLLDQRDNGVWLTTTEISVKLNLKFMLEKSKNNVSRYFNQGFHPYFEARIRVSNGRKTQTVEYRLSPTGISEAKILVQTSMAPNPQRKIQLLTQSHQTSFKFGSHS
ncbi:non-canonical purine NTP pyrophosphatase [Herminiimonas aquatilis]|uniref:Non-canonical purine NTP pyrophosphatase n=1 Tax=Herminiimonas aquatilis TaxID=345342 RepID=A0ABW2J333_9BURK